MDSDTLDSLYITHFYKSSFKVYKFLKYKKITFEQETLGHL